MKNKEEINKAILKVENLINTEFPELSKYIGEMPVNISYKAGVEISIENLKDYYNSLNELIKHYALSHKNKISVMKNSDLLNTEITSEKNANLPGYPFYEANDDIYAKAIEETNLDPENTTKNKIPNETIINNEKSFIEDVSGNDLDVPGSELDDDMENIGSEDEENNYYSLGGENHENLDEDKAGI